MTKAIQKNLGGRPTKYNDSILSKGEEYLLTTGREQTRLPKLTEFYRYIGISKETASQWRKTYVGFSDLCKKIEERQLETLMDDGMYGGKEVNPGVAIFLMKSKHGLKESDPNTLVQVNVTPILEEKAR